MPIDVDRAMSARIAESTYTWDEDRVILYHLGIGAGSPPTDPGELRYAYEADLTVLPTFGTLPPFSVMINVGSVDGIDVDLAMLLHGEHELEVHGDIPSSGSVHQKGRIAGVYDKGKGALVIVEVESTLVRTGEILFTNRASLFIRGEGGFGGEPGSPPGPEEPEREPDVTVESPTLPQQALLYRLSGDKNPLHADPAFAALGGFDRPILHGLCSYGIVAKALVDRALDGDTGRFGSYRARFSGVVFPGETIVTRAWDEGDRWLVAAETRERSSPVISNAVVRLRG